MLTFEHLSLMARDRGVNPPARAQDVKIVTPLATPTTQLPANTIIQPLTPTTKLIGINQMTPPTIVETPPILTPSSEPTPLTPLTPPICPLTTPLLSMDAGDSDSRINHVPLLFDVIQLLPRCRQAELLFSMPVQDWQVRSQKI